jgi:zinc/manganese transport system permease protein
MDLSIWEIMAPAFLECLVLVGIHSYLGLHVIRRKVIFVDLALAQIAALGTTVGFLVGIMPNTIGAYWFSLGFTILGAGIFSISRLRHEKIPQEAVIGLTYAIAASVSVLVIDKAPHGAEHIKEIITGSILWVKWSTILAAAIVYVLVGIFHFIFRKQFILISENPEKAYNQGLSIRFWDFLFYMSFGIVITHSVGTAGVLLVFVFLVVPAIASTMITNTLWKQLVIGWVLGVVVSSIGLYLSYQLDIPSGPTIVSVYGLVLILIAITLYISRAANRIQAIRKVMVGIIITIIIMFGFHSMAQWIKGTYHEHEHVTFISEEEHILHEIKVHERLNRMSDDEVTQFLDQQNDAKFLHSIFDAEEDGYLRFKIVKRLIQINHRDGLELMVDLLVQCELPFLKDEIVRFLRLNTGQNFGFEVEKTADENEAAIREWRKWVHELFVD